MQFDLDDTIVAAASASGGAARGVVRLSGAAVRELCERTFVPATVAQSLPTSGPPQILPGTISIAGLGVPATLHWWPTHRSYTRQPVAEFHLPGSPPLVQGVVDALAAAGARPARPGEFTLRAFLAGRVDLTQAEAVLGVIDARGGDDLAAALRQLAGGISQPLHRLRANLLDLLAELEAGLDFADEVIEFIAPAELASRLAEAAAIVAATRDQLQMRFEAGASTRVALVGPPNAGKSSLFNALHARWGRGEIVPALVSPIAGTTRDYLTATLDLGGLAVELIDTAGVDAQAQAGIDTAAQAMTDAAIVRADVQIVCHDATRPVSQIRMRGDADLFVATKEDLGRPTTNDDPSEAALFPLTVSARTGSGLTELVAAIRDRVAMLLAEAGGNAVAATAARTAGSLRQASDALLRGREMVAAASSEELVAAEIRIALHALGEVVGAVVVDDVLDRVFSRFCIGK